MHTNPFFKVIDYILIIVAIVVFAYFANNFVRNQAIDGCAKSYVYSQNLIQQNASAEYPMKAMYEKCLKDKGIQ